METKQTKAKRRLKELTFDHENAHLAVTSKAQGGAANGQNKMFCMKSTSEFSKEFIEKAQAVRVTMELPDFLEKFFGMWEDDAAVLAALMGYVEDSETPEGENAEDSSGMYEDDSFWSWFEERLPEGVDPWTVDPTDQDYQDYIAARLQGIEILMSLKSSDNLFEEIAKLKEEDCLTILKAQETFEKACSNKGKMLKKGNVKTKRSYVAKSEKSTTASAGTDKEVLTKSEESMSKQNTDTASVQAEVVEKSQFEAVQKAFEEQKELLEKALARIESYEAEKKEAIQKARFVKLQDVVKDQAKAETIFKAVSLVEAEEDFESVVKAIGELAKLADSNEMFVEKGASTVEDQVKEDPLVKAIKDQIKTTAK